MSLFSSSFLRALFFFSFFVGHHVGQLVDHLVHLRVGHHVYHLVFLDVGHRNFVLTLCEVSETLTEIHKCYGLTLTDGRMDS